MSSARRLSQRPGSSSSTGSLGIFPGLGPGHCPKIWLARNKREVYRAQKTSKNHKKILEKINKHGRYMRGVAQWFLWASRPAVLWGLWQEPFRWERSAGPRLENPADEEKRRSILPTMDELSREVLSKEWKWVRQVVSQAARFQMKNYWQSKPVESQTSGFSSTGWWTETDGWRSRQEMTRVHRCLILILFGYWNRWFGNESKSSDTCLGWQDPLR